MADTNLLENSSDLSKLKVPDLKKELKQRGLSTTGNKNELIERLQNAVKSNETINSECVDDLEEDLLNDEDDDHEDASESVILDNELDEGLPSLPVKRKADETSATETIPEPPKKVVLKRISSSELDTEEEKSEPEKVDAEFKPEEDKHEDKKVIKLSELTTKERLEMRAKKFGVIVNSPDAKKAARAERFGTSNASADSITSSQVNTKLDVLKQRAARFGVSVSSAMSNLENKEKLEKRKQRFGSDTEGKSSNGVSESDKAKLRLERFKEPVK
uniref:SAP domain-containing ribonucleoprotein n=1 Tax=Diabrotica virgifera virgifera TaxID=50390 RepID=A0A6P7H4J7_DIAVI